MNHLCKGLLLLTVGFTFFSCENETIDQGIIENTAEENSTVTDIVTFSGLTGNIGKSFNYIDGKSKAVENLSEAEAINAKFLYIDTDSMDSLGYSYDDLLDWSSETKTGLIFESATGNHEMTNDFYLNEVGASALDYTVEGLVVEQSQLEDKTTFVVINKENGIGAEDTIEIFLNELYESKYPTILDTTSIDEEEEFYDNDNPIVTEVFTEEDSDRSGKTVGNVTTLSVTYTNISQSSAEAKAKALALKRAGNNSKFSSFSNYKYNLKAKLITQKNQRRKYLKTGSRHDASGKCKGQQTATYSRSMSYSKTWSTTFSTGVDVGPVTFGGSFSVGGSKTSGTANTSSLSMRKRYAQGGVSVSQKYCTGYVSGDIKFKATARKQIRGQVQVNTTLKFTGTKNTWKGWRQKSKPAFTWEATGYTLRNCN